METYTEEQVKNVLFNGLTIGFMLGIVFMLAVQHVVEWWDSRGQ